MEVEIMIKTTRYKFFYNCKQGRLEEVKKHIQEKLEINEVNSSGRTGLIYAAWYGRLAVASFLIESGCDVNLRDNNGDTALIYAVSCREIEITKILLKANADVSIQDNNRFTSLATAFIMGDPETVELLLSYGADINDLFKDNVDQSINGQLEKYAVCRQSIIERYHLLTSVNKEKWKLIRLKTIFV